MGLASKALRFLKRALDPFGEREREREEWRLLCDIRAARRREAALAVGGRGDDEVVEKLAEELAKTRAEIADLTAGLPRGDTPAFVALCFFCAAMIAFLVMPYAAIGGEIVEMWGSLDNPYLLRYRRTATLLFRVGRVLTTPLWTGIGLAALLGTLWYLQRRLERRHARGLVTIAAAIVIVAVLLLVGALFRLLMMPLMMSLG